ncbi:hypothetical protein [Pseudomonas shahriarae]|uniref:Uncharacterized protein n=1 Tax=Pseudomonas shahriarae TaxID=2745512 RepID=A0ABT5NED9_9PSED|nr:hypothetical protein [Pseudomonas shahriarae]MDD0985794.1 hypothetical protein [Pseudomonas shahriarae]MDD1032732.1 hypothetical protein [Pseudomonas shahriarae]
MSRTETFHHFEDGRGRRRVFVNGNEVSHVKWCDTDKGIAIYCPLPLRLKRPSSDEVYTRRLTGVVTVEKVE